MSEITPPRTSTSTSALSAPTAVVVEMPAQGAYGEPTVRSATPTRPSFPLFLRNAIAVSGALASFVIAGFAITKGFLESFTPAIWIALVLCLLALAACLSQTRPIGQNP